MNTFVQYVKIWVSRIVNYVVWMQKGREGRWKRGWKESFGREFGGRSVGERLRDGFCSAEEGRDIEERRN